MVPGSRGRLYWRLSNNAACHPDSQTDEATGNEVVLSYTFTRADVSERVPLLITLRSSGEFHREPGPSASDATAMFNYAVNPPSDRR